MNQRVKEVFERFAAGEQESLREEIKILQGEIVHLNQEAEISKQEHESALENYLTSLEEHKLVTAALKTQVENLTNEISDKDHAFMQCKESLDNQRSANEYLQGELLTANNLIEKMKGEKSMSITAPNDERSVATDEKSEKKKTTTKKK